jgi:hypothetical protein
MAEARTIMLNVQLRDKEARLIKSEAKRRTVRFEVGDQVLVSRPAAASNKVDKVSAKLLWAAVGPMEVEVYLGKNCYRVRNLSTGKEFRVNARDMFPYCKKTQIAGPEEGLPKEQELKSWVTWKEL